MTWDGLNLKDKLLDELISREGGYVNDPADSGGETNYGITIGVARRYGYTGPMRELTLGTAKEIYKARYWNRLWLDQIAEIAPHTAEELFDTGVNMGTGRAAKFLQRALNAFDAKATLVVDGQIGPATIKVLKKYINKRKDEGDIILKRALDSQQGNFYLTLVERRVKDKRFAYGWFKNRIG